MQLRKRIGYCAHETRIFALSFSLLPPGEYEITSPESHRPRSPVRPHSIARTTASYQLVAGLFGIAAVLGIVLAGVGLCGLGSYGVNRRAHEIGVRVAMGAKSGDVLRLVCGRRSR